MDYDKAQDVIITILEETTSMLLGNKEAKRNICKSKEINLLAFSFYWIFY